MVINDPTAAPRRKPFRGTLATTAGEASPEWRGLWRGLVLACPMVEGGGNVVDLVAGRQGVLHATDAKWVAGPDGPRVRKTTSGGTPAVNFGSSSFVPTANVSVVIKRRRNLPADAGSFGGFGLSGAGSSADCGAHLPFSNTVYWDFGDGRINTAALTFGPDDLWVFTAGAHGQEIWRNGVLLVSDATPRTRVANGALDYLLGQHRGSFGGQEEDSLFLMYDRRLDQSEIRRLNRDPWGPFRKTRQDHLRYAPSPAAPPTLATAPLGAFDPALPYKGLFDAELPYLSFFTREMARADPATGDTANGASARIKVLATAGTTTVGGVSATGARASLRVLATAGSVTVGGISATGASARVRLLASAGSATVGGVSATGARASLKLVASAGSVTVGSVSATGARSTLRLLATSGSTTVGGVTASGSRATLRLLATAGTTTLGGIVASGASATLYLRATPGDATLTGGGGQTANGASATLRLLASAGSVTLGGISAEGVPSTLRLLATAGSVTNADSANGAPATLRLVATAGSVEVGGATIEGTAARIRVLATAGSVVGGEEPQAPPSSGTGGGIITIVLPPIRREQARSLGLSAGLVEPSEPDAETEQPPVRPVAPSESETASESDEVPVQPVSAPQAPLVPLSPDEVNRLLPDEDARDEPSFAAPVEPVEPVDFGALADAQIAEHAARMAAERQQEMDDEEALFVVLLLAEAVLS